LLKDQQKKVEKERPECKEWKSVMSVEGLIDLIEQEYGLLSIIAN